MKRLIRRLGRLVPGSKRKAPRSQVVPCGRYSYYVGTMPVDSAGGQSPVRPLYTEEQLTAAVTELRAMMARDHTPECQAALKAPFAAKLKDFTGHWFQRIDFPQHGISSTSDRSAVHWDEGSYNRLAARLSSEEACVLRPWPKWYYLKPLLPNLAGKTVLEVGSSNGFFSLRFAELGARQVTGIEVVKAQYESARWSADVLGVKNIEFKQTDFLLDLTLQPHDVVFLSEVQNHFLFPLYGLLRLINLARETVVLDAVADYTPDHGLTLNSGWENGTGRLLCQSFHLTDGLLLDFLNLVGVPGGCVVRYRAPDDPNHVVYVIDTRSVPEIRRKRFCPEYLRDAMELKFKFPAGVS